MSQSRAKRVRYRDRLEALATPRAREIRELLGAIEAADGGRRRRGVHRVIGAALQIPPRSVAVFISRRVKPPRGES